MTARIYAIHPQRHIDAEIKLISCSNYLHLARQASNTADDKDKEADDLERRARIIRKSAAYYRDVSNNFLTTAAEFLCP